MAKQKKIIAISAPATIEAGAMEGEKKQPSKFNVLAYTGGVLPGALRGSDSRDDVILDLAGLKNGKSLIANLDHESTQRVGNVNAIGNDGKELVLAGIASAATAARDEVVNSAADGFVWQASVEADPTKVELVKPGATVAVNGQEFTAPKHGPALYVARESVLKGFAFVSHGADDNTTVSIAASAASTKEKAMKAEVKAWAEGMGIQTDSLTDEQVATIEANFEGRNGTKAKKVTASNPFDERKIEAKRRNDIRDVADKFIERNPHDYEFITAVEKMHDHAIEATMSVQDFRNEMYESMVPMAQTVPSPRNRDPQLNGRFVEAAICMTGRLADDSELVSKYRFTDQELQAAHDRFRGGIGLKDIAFALAKANGHDRGYSTQVTSDTLRAACGQTQGRVIHAASGFSPNDITTTVSATANKFAQRGFNNVDMTPLQISRIRSVRNFQQITTVSLTGAGMLEQLGPGGQIKHKALGEQTYTNQADTYAGMLSITRKDWINDDLSVLTDAPMKLGLGAGRKLNDIFWTEWLGGEGAGFWAAGNNNLNSGAADATIGGLTATEVIFLNQTDYDSTPLGVLPWGIVCPTALKAAFIALMDPQGRMVTGASSTIPDSNPFKGRFQVFSSPYMSNTSYSGYSAQEWYLIANPAELAVIEIVALNGQIEPTIEQAEADFNTLGMQMRAIADVGVNLQEKKASVLADGNAS